MTLEIDQHYTAGQAKACRALVAAILADPAGFVVSTQDGEEWVVIRSRDEAEILASLGSTGEDRIAVMTPERVKVGTFWLVWGNSDNGEELIADWSWNPKNPDAESIMDRLAHIIPDGGY